METVIYEKQNHMAFVTLNRPQVRNAYNDQMNGELDTVWKDVRGDANVWVAVLTGAGREAFCAGRDAKELSEYQQRGQLVPRYDPASPTYGQFGAHLGNYNISKPLVAAINGFAVGGGLGMILACDLRIMSETAWLGDLHVNIAQVGSTWPIGQAMPVAIAAELVMMGNRISAQRAYEIGLVNKVVPPDAMMAEATRVAERVCEMAPVAVQRSKEIMRTLLRPEAGLMQLAEHYMAEMRLTEDGREGPLAFREKRKPVWKGR